MSGIFLKKWRENMALERKTKAGIIIHGFAVSAATVAGGFGFIPILGPVVGDTTALTAITIAMTYSLAALFEKKLETGLMFSYGAVVVGAVFGTSLLKAGVSLIPFFGSGINATITFALHEAIGWGLYLIFEAGGDPTTMSREEFVSYLDKGKIIAKEVSENYNKLLESLPKEARLEIEQLQKQMTDKNLSEEKRSEIAKKIVNIFEIHEIHKDRT